MYSRIINERKAQVENPIKSGSAVLETNLPIIILIGTAIMVEMKPVIAAAIPAICPTGFMAIALIFPNKNPNAKNCNEKKLKSTATGGFVSP